MKDKIEAILAEIESLECKTENEIEEARVRLLGKKGEITRLFEEFRTVAPELKREFGKSLNELKNAAAAKIESLKAAAEENAGPAASSFDLTMPGDSYPLGSHHPVSIARKEIIDIFHELHAQGNTIVLITHDPNVAKQAARSIHILDGRISEVKL